MASVSDVLARALAAHTHHVFSLMGNGNAYLIDALVAQGMPLTAVRHEAATVAAADAYHRHSGCLAVATTTYGPGYTNTLTALAEAALARTPLLLVVGDQPSTGPRPWDVDQAAAAAALGVQTMTVGPDDVATATAQAVHRALVERRPVVLAVPYDLATAEAVDIEVPALPPMPTPLVPAPDDVEAVVRLLTRATSPVVLAGRGARPAATTLQLLADAAGSWTATTAPARGMFSGPRDLGVAGGFAAPGAAAVLREADVVLVLGAGLNQFTTGFGTSFSPDARIVQVDVSPTATHPAVSDHVRADAALFATALLAAVRRELPDGPPSRPAPPAGLLERSVGDGALPGGCVDPRSLSARLDEILPARRVVASDGGHFMGWPNMYLDLPGPDHITLVGTAFQSIGLGFPSAVGVVAAAPDATVVIVTGDGGGLMALPDLETIVREAASAVVVVYNDSAYGAEVHQYASQGLDRGPMVFPDVDFCALGRAFGAEGAVVRTLDDLADLERWVREGARGTYVVDARIPVDLQAPFMHEMAAAAHARRPATSTR